MTRTKHKSFSLTAVFTALLLTLTLNLNAAPTTDGEVLDVVKTANTAEITAAEYAAKNASSPKVREFASAMIKEHGKNNKEADKVSSKASVIIQPSDTSTTLKTDADTKFTELKAVPANSKAFDRKYVEQQIAMHNGLIKDIDETLIPTAQNSDVQKYLKDTKAHVQRHLAKATALLSEL